MIPRQPREPSGKVMLTATGLRFTAARLTLIASTLSDQEPQVPTGVFRVRSKASTEAPSIEKPEKFANVLLGLSGWKKGMVTLLLVVLAPQKPG